MPESVSSAQVSSTGFQRQPVALSNPAYTNKPCARAQLWACFPFARNSVGLGKMSCFLPLAPTKSLSEESFWTKGPGALRCSGLQSDKKGLRASPDLEIPWVCFVDRAYWPPALVFWSWEVDMLQISPFWHAWAGTGPPSIVFVYLLHWSAAYIVFWLFHLCLPTSCESISDT